MLEFECTGILNVRNVQLYW